MGDLDEQLKELRALRNNLTWTLSADATKVRYNRVPSTSRAASREKRIKGKLRKLDFPIPVRESKFVLVEAEKSRGLPTAMYTLARLMVTTYDVLGLLHLIQVPVDHTFRPPVPGPPSIVGSQPSVDVIEPM